MHHRSYLLWFPVIVITAAVGWVNQLVTCVRSDNLRGFATLLLASLTGAFAPRKGVPCRKTLDVGDVCSWFTLPPNLQQAVEVQPRHAFLTHSLKTIRLRTYLVLRNRRRFLFAYYSTKTKKIVPRLCRPWLPRGARRRDGRLLGTSLSREEPAGQR